MAVIEAAGLSKSFRVPEREAGLGAALRGLLRRRYRDVHAVRGINLRIVEGEVVGFLGPNGAGKTTTLKMLSGLLHPSGGAVRVLGFEPWRRQRAFLQQISLVMGQRSQLAWDLPAADSFEVQLAVYDVQPALGAATRAELIELLQIGDVLRKPVRTLSLGERMKCELCMALLHRPRVLFLDEPTIGVDITMQARIRAFIGDYNRRHGATVILTSHYMADVTALCRRIVVINNGVLLFDGPLTALVERFAPFKFITIEFERDADTVDAARFGQLVTAEARRWVLQVPRERAPDATARLLAELPVLDLSIQDPPIETVIQSAFTDRALPSASAEPQPAPAFAGDQR